MRVGKRKTLTGTVKGAGMTKSITVNVERRYRHPKYGKYVVASKRFVAHDENNDARAGDRVEIVATRPLSKTKRWRLVRVLERAPVYGEESAK